MITLAGNWHDFVSWYEQALRGAFFAKRETLTEFKRIQAMSEQIARAVPSDTPAYAKGGEFPAAGTDFGAHQRQELCRADRGRRRQAHASYVLLHRELERDYERLCRGRSRVLRGHQGHSEGY